MIPRWILWLIGCSGVVMAAFRAWRDQKRLTEATELQLKEKSESYMKAIERALAENNALQQQLDIGKQKEIGTNSIKPTLDLEIEGIPLAIYTAQYHFCQIRVHNRNATKTADNFQVELISLEDSFEPEIAAAYYRTSFPIILKPAINGSNTINPGGNLVYNLFRVTRSIKSLIRAPDGTGIGWQQRFLAFFTQDDTKNVTQFIEKHSYRLKLAATARDFLKAEQEFCMTFSDEVNFHRFTLNKTVEKSAI